MMGRLRSRRAAAEAEGPFRGPEHFALAMPLLAVAALMLVVSAAATGQSAQIVAILAVAGLGLCAVAPVALLEMFVGRPLRAALAQLRAARDGKETIGSAPPGVIGDLVAVAQDIRAGQSHLGHYQAALSLCERMVAAGDEAIRAFRLQSEELAETAVLSESQLRRSAQSQFAEIAEAMKALKSSAPAGFDSGTERIEQMLVYLAETLERGEARDLRADGASTRLEQSLADLARLIGRETEAIRGSVSSASLLVRDDVASTVAETKAARARQIERLETMEARVLTKLADAAAPDSGRIVEAIRAQAETTRRALGERVELALQPLLANNSPDAAVWAGVVEATADISRRLRSLDRFSEELPATRSALEKSTARFDAAALASDAAAHDEFAEALARIGEELARLRPGENVEGLREEIRASASDLAEAIANLGARFNGASVGEIVARGVAEIGERLRLEGETLAGRMEEVESRVAERILAIERDAEATTLTALIRTTGKLGHAIDRLDALSTAAAGASTAQDDGFRAEVRSLAAEWTAAGSRLEAAVAAQAAAANEAGDASFAELRAAFAAASEAAASRFDAVSQGLGAKLDESLDALRSVELTPAVAALRHVTDEVGKTSAQLSAELNELRSAAASDRPQLDALREEVSAVAAALSESAKAAERASGEQAQALDGRIAEFADGLGRTLANEVAQLRDTLHTGAEEESAADLAGEIGRRFDAFEETQAERAEALELRVAARAVTLDRTAVASALTVFRAMTEEFAQTKARLDEAVAALGGRDETTSADAPAPDGGEETLAALAADLGSRFDAFAEAQNERLQALDLRLSARAAGLDRTSVAAALTVFRSMTRNLAEAVDRLQGAAAAIEGRDAREAAAQDDNGVLRAELLAVGGAVRDAAAQLDGRFEDFTESQAKRLETLELRIVGQSASIDRTSVAAALTAFRALTRDMVETLEHLKTSAATGAETAPGEVGELRAELRAIGDVVSGAAARIDDRLAALSADHNERLVGFETRLAGRQVGLDRTAVASALTVFRALSREFADGVARFDAATGLVQSHVASAPDDLRALAGAVAGQGERLDGFAEAQNARLDGLELRLAARSLAVDRTAVASALTAFRAMGSTLQDTVARFEAATETLEARALAPSAAEALDLPGDMRALAGELAEIGGRLDAFASVQTEAVGRLAQRLSPDDARSGETLAAESLAAAVARLDAAAVALDAGAQRFATTPSADLDALRGELRGVIELVTASLSGFAGQIARATPPGDAEAGDPEWREAVDALGGRLAETLADLERRLTATAASARRSPEFNPSVEPKSSGALAKIVMSLADSLDYRFAEIERNLGDLFAKLQAADARRENPAVGPGTTALVKQLNSASEILKTGLSDFVGISAALVEDIDARNRGGEISARQNNSLKTH